MLCYFPVSAPLMVIFGLLPWVTDLLWLRISTLAVYLFLQYKIYAFARAEAKSDADTHVYSSNWRPVEGVLVFIFIMACFVAMFMLFVSMFLSHFISEADLAKTQAMAQGLLFGSSGVLLIYELSLPAAKLEEDSPSKAI